MGREQKERENKEKRKEENPPRVQERRGLVLRKQDKEWETERRIARMRKRAPVSRMSAIRPVRNLPLLLHW